GSVFLPPGAAEIAAHDTFDGKRIRFANQHGAAGKLVAMGAERSGEVVSTENVVGNDVFQQLKPEKRDLCEDFSFVGYGSWHYDVEGREPVGGDDEEPVAEIIDVANLAARRGREARKICFAKYSHCGRGRHRRFFP